MRLAIFRKCRLQSEPRQKHREMKRQLRELKPKVPGRDLCRNLPGVLATGFVANAEPTPHLLTAQWGEFAQYAILSDCRVVMNTASRQYFASLNQCYQSFRKLCSCAFKQFGVTNQFQKNNLGGIIWQKESMRNCSVLSSTVE